MRKEVTLAWGGNTLKGVAPLPPEPRQLPFSSKSLLVPVEHNGSGEIFAQLLKNGNLPLF